VLVSLQLPLHTLVIPTPAQDYFPTTDSMWETTTAAAAGADAALLEPLVPAAD
jgi:hypothetical protein